MCGAHLQQQKAVTIAFPNALLPDNTIPCVMVGSHSCIEVSKDEDFVCQWDCGDECTQLVVELTFVVVRVCHGWSIDTKQRSIPAVAQRKLKRHKAITVADGKFSELLQEV